MFAVSIWPDGLQINAVAQAVLQSGGCCLEAVERALRFAEDQLEDHSTGVGGAPNAEGEVELDAAIMEAATARIGAVAALKETHYAISVARRVMEKSPHMLLVGEGAKAFARREGFEYFNLLTDESRQAWQNWKDKQQTSEDSHDTRATIAIDQNGDLAVGVTTSGLAYKLPGRVGDSPLVGAGLYCLRGVGGAAATGHGEEAMRICASFQVVAFMQQGCEPAAACSRTLQKLLEIHPQSATKQLALAALRADGRAGGASLQDGFAYAYAEAQKNRMIPVRPLKS